MKKILSFALLFLSFNSFAVGRWVEITTNTALGHSCEIVVAKANDLESHRQAYEGLAVPEHKADFSLDVNFIGSCTNDKGVYSLRYQLMGYTCDPRRTKLTLAGTCPDEIPSKENCLKRDNYTGQLFVALKKNGERYADIEGCVFNATGVIVCDSEDKSCAADWKPTGDVSKDFFGDTDNSGGDTDNSGGDTDYSEPFDYAKNANEIKKSLTEKYDENSVMKSLTESFDKFTDSVKTQDENTESSLKGLINGDGDVSGEFKEIGGHLNNIGSNTEDSILFPFINADSLFPNLPKPKKCESLIFGEGKIYEFNVDCKYIDMFKIIFAFILYCLTALYYINTLSGLLRNKEV